LLNIIKSNDFSFNEQSIKIPDTVVLRSAHIISSIDNLKNTDIDLSAYSKEDMDKLEKYFSLRKSELLSSVTFEISQLQAKADKIIADADNHANEVNLKLQNQASKVIDNANIVAKGIIENANKKAIDICNEAREQGRLQGCREKSDEISDCILKLNDFMIELKKAQNKQFDEFLPKLKYLAIEIAQKITFKKISENDSFLYELVVQSLKEFKEPEWITVEISEQMSGLISFLNQQQSAGIMQHDVDFVPSDSENGSIILESDSEMLDVSVINQLKNIKTYFDSYGDDFNDELQSENNENPA
jgi:flagellar assembly protein FliH